MEDVGQNITRAIVDELTNETFQASRPWMCNEAIKGQKSLDYLVPQASQ